MARNLADSNVSISGWYIQMLQIIFPCGAMVYANIVSINVNFVTIHETGINSGKIIKIFRGIESLKHLLTSCNPFFNIAVVFRYI